MSNRSTPPSKGAKVITQLLLGPLEAAVFCLYWNIFQVHVAIGHGLGTVNYWTALGVDVTVSSVISAFALAFWGAKYFARNMSIYANEND